ncbi:MAG TPA: serine/threonine-protein kinase [Polyangiaceae bacterium]
MEIITTLNYRRIEEIGSAGQNSKVFRVFDEHLHAELAVKEIQKSRLGDPSRYFSEARAVHASAHARVVPIRWAGKNDEIISLAMPIMPGGSLSDRIREKPLRASEVIKIGQDLCEGVAQVHIAGFVHLDIKPTNVLFDVDGRASVSDFGLALKLDDMATADARDQALYPSFFPPEMMNAKGVVSPASDVYQVGLTLFRALMGDAAFKSQWARIREPYPAGRDAIRAGTFPERVFLPGVPLALRKAILSALHVDPALRQVGARKLAEELAAVEVKHDWEVEGYAPSEITWRLRSPDRADVVVLQRGELPASSVEIWTESAAGRRKKTPDAWSSKIRTMKQLRAALSRAFRSAES